MLNIGLLKKFRIIVDPLFPSILQHHCLQILYTTNFLRENVFISCTAKQTKDTNTIVNHTLVVCRPTCSWCMATCTLRSQIHKSFASRSSSRNHSATLSSRAESILHLLHSSISLVRSDVVPDAGIARYFSAILETVSVGKLWECGKCGKTGGVGRWISFLPPN